MLRILLAVLFLSPLADAATITFFNSGQTATQIATGDTSDTILSNGYEFTYTRDKYWYPTITLGGGTPTGRFTSVNWPDGLQAQAVTAGPSGLLGPGDNTSARFSIRRADGEVFDIPIFTAKLLANTAGAGAHIEVMPLLNGEDAFSNPLMLNATGYGGNSFTYNTPSLVGFDTYKMSLYVDYALTGITFVDASVPEPTMLGMLIFLLPLGRRTRH